MARFHRRYPSGSAKTTSIRMDSLTYRKIAYLASYYGRSATAQIDYICRVNVKRFEQEQGEITEDLLALYEANPYGKLL